MSPPRVSLLTFLKTARSHLQNYHKSPSTPLTFVIGNESADLDSLCSAILLAYLKTYSPSPKPNNGIYIPISNLPRADLRLRTELRPVLKHANLSPNDLITLSDLPFSTSTSFTSKDIPQSQPQSQPQQSNEDTETRWFLVDHNVLTGPLGHQFGERVVGVIDHHLDEGKNTELALSPEGEGRIIKTVGSCTSLIIEEFRNSWPQVQGQPQDSSQQKVWDAEIAVLALGSITIDTSNLQAVDRTTDIDRDAVEFLDGLISQSSGSGGNEFEGFDRDAFYEEVSKAKEDLTHLTLPEILRKDYKSWSSPSSSSSSSSSSPSSSSSTTLLGLSATPTPLSHLLQKSPSPSKTNFLSSIEEFAQERNLDIYGIMTTSTVSQRFVRELFLCGRTTRGVRAVRKFERDDGEILGLRGWEGGLLDDGGDEDGDGDGKFKVWRKAWIQEKTEKSRKQVAPLLRDAML